jgi:hypothetical protein
MADLRDIQGRLQKEFYDRLRNPYPSAIPDQIIPRDMNLRDRMHSGILNMMGENTDPVARRRAQGIMSAMDFGPGAIVGAVDLLDAQNAYNRGDMAEAVIGTGTGLMSMIPGGRPAAQQAETIGRSILNKARPAITLSDLPRANIVQTVPRQVKTAERVGTTGAYRGAPRNVDSEEALGNMRKSLQNSLSRGTIGRDWYEKSSRTASELTGGREGYKDLYSGTVALTSAGASVPANQTFAVRGFNQAITGNQIDTGRFPTNAAAGVQGMLSGVPTEFGPKRGPFYEALNVPPGESASRPTNDLWMARAFDYRTPEGEIWSEGLGEAQHRFMDKEINNLVDWANENKVGGFTNWTPEKVQASIWVDTKALSEGTSVGAAAYDFSDNLRPLTANINVESEPARGLMHLAGSQDNPTYSQLLQQGQRQVLSNDQGQDMISLAAGGLTRQTAPGYGYYKGVSAPADTIRVMAAPSSGSNQIDPASRGLLEGIAATQGLLRGQESVGYNFVRPGGKLVERNAAMVDIGRPAEQAQMLSVGARLDEEFGGAIIPTNTDYGMNYLVVDDLSGWAKSNEIDPNNAEAVAKGWQAKLRQITKAELDAKPEFGVNSGDLVGSFEAFKPSEYLPAIERSGVTGLLSTAAQQAAPGLEQLDAALVKEFPDIGVRSQILMTTRQALAEGGIGRVRELVNQGILPVVALAAIGTAAVTQQQSRRDGGKNDGV